MIISSFREMDETLQQNIKKQKERVFGGTQTDIPSEYSSLSAEWQESLSMGIDPHLTQFSSSNFDQNTITNISAYLKSYKSYYSDFFRFMQTTLAAHGCAIFYLDSNGSVYNKFGDNHLIGKLRDKGLRFSTNFSPSTIGINVASIAWTIPGTVVRRYGEENFLDIFTPFVCYARAIKRKNTHGMNTILVFVPVHKFSPAVEELVLNLYNFEDIISSKLVEANEEKRIKLLKLSAIADDKGILLCDDQGKILYINEFLEELVGIPEKFCLNRQLEDFFPDLYFCLNTLKTGRNLPPYEIKIDDKYGDSILFYAECSVIRDKNNIEGLKIALIETANIKRRAKEPSKGSAHYRFEDMKGESVAFKQVINNARRVANTPSNVLIFGESGTGKELLAHSIHNHSARWTKPFIPLNCGAIPKDLIASELFGYDDGAFTGARKGGSTGKLEQANGGTLFLDEIGEMPYDMQATLLRFLEDGVVYKIGGKNPIPLDVRIISATNKNLIEYVEQGKFRLDLYYRLNVVKLILPPLRERYGDIHLLAEHMLESMANDFGIPKTYLSDDVKEVFQGYSWPGNLREMRNVLESCIHIADGIINIEHLPLDMFHRLEKSRKSENTVETNSPLPNNREQHLPAPSRIYNEYQINKISELMIKHGGNKSAVADELGIARSTLYRKLKDM